MDKKYIQENEIDIKYLRGQLSDDELELFEIYLMENPEFVENMKVESLLNDNFAHVNQDALVEESRVRGFFLGILDAPYQLLSGISIGAVSSLLLLNILSTDYKGVEITQVGSLSQLRSGGVSDASGTVLEFEKSLFQSANTAHFVLTVPANIQPSISYRVKIVDEQNGDEKLLLNVTEAHADQYGTLILSLMVNHFSPGLYRIEITPELNETEFTSENFVFETKLKG